MSIIKTGIIAATSAVGILGAAPAHAQFYVAPQAVRFAPQPMRVAAPPARPLRYAHGRVRWHRPVYRYEAPIYPTAQPLYQGYYEDSFAGQVSAELAELEGAVRARVYAGELDGSALTAMESARNDIQEDVVDVSAKGFIDPADRAHIEGDIQALRQKFGC
jgi:hypothetical protein